MKNRFYEVLKSIVLAASAVTLVLVSPMIAKSETKELHKVAALKSEAQWKDFYAVPGACSMKFPEKPEHFTEKMNVPDEGYDLRYDAYISTVDKQMIFMLLIAQYPTFVDESYAQMSLEGFLNGILRHNPGNQLIFADLLLVDGREALDFFIRTGGVYFKGRAMMVKNSLYLMAMECEVQHYDEKPYNTFVNSFSLAQDKKER